MSLKRKRKEGSPLLEMPDLSQTQKIHSQISASSSRVLDLQLDSMQVELELFCTYFFWKDFKFHLMLENELLCLCRAPTPPRFRSFRFRNLPSSPHLTAKPRFACPG